MTAETRVDDGSTIHGILSAAPEQRLAAAVIGQAVEDAIMRPSPNRRREAYHWLMTPAALWWIRLITPADHTPQEIQRMAVITARTGRRAREDQAD